MNLYDNLTSYQHYIFIQRGYKVWYIEKFVTYIKAFSEELDNFISFLTMN